MILSLMSFEQYMNWFKARFSYFSIMTFLWNYLDFRVFTFGCKAENENPEIMENLYFLGYEAEMHLDLFYDHYFNFLSVRNDTEEAATGGFL